MGGAVAEPTEASSVMTVSDCARYKCNICPKEVHVSADEGLPEDWVSLVPTFQHPQGWHICGVCAGPVRKVRKVFQDARQVFIEACEAAGKGNVKGEQLAKGLEGDWGDGNEIL